MLQYNLLEQAYSLRANNLRLYQTKVLKFLFDYFLRLVHLDNDKLLQYYLMLAVKMDFVLELDNNNLMLVHDHHYLYELTQYYIKYTRGAS